MLNCLRSRSKGYVRPWTALAIFLFFSACGDSGTGPTPAPAVAIAISPTSATVGAAETQSLSASVSNATNQGVTWSATGGAINGSGAAVTWTAPVEGGSYSVTVTSVEDGSKSATATITVTGVSITLDPASATLLRDEPTSFTAAVSGTTASNDITWDATCGDLVPDGSTAAYTAPKVAGDCVVSATSVLDATKSASAQVTVRSASVVTAQDGLDDGSCTWEHCSLREAMNAANAAPDLDTIFLSPAAVTSGPQGAVGVGRGAGVQQIIEPSLTLPTAVTSMALIGEGSAVTVIDMNGTEINPRRGLQVSGAAGGVVLSIRGITVREAVAGGGPALHVRDGASVHAYDLALMNNSSPDGEGGAMAVVGEGSLAVLEDVVVDGNQTGPGWPGGGISVVAGGSLRMTGGRISNNMTPAWGGGVRGFDFVELTMENTVIESNQVTDGGFGGGGMFLENPAGLVGTVTLTGVSVKDNSTVGAGGGGGMHIRTHLAATVSNSTFSGNSATSGAGISAGNVTLVLNGTSVSENVSTERGGGVYLWGNAAATVTDGMVNENTAGSPGGAGFFVQELASLNIDGTLLQGNIVTGAAGGAFGVFHDAQLTGTDVEVRSNRGAGGGALFFAGNAASTVSFTNSTFDGNSAEFGGGALFAQGSGTLTLTGGVFSNNAAEGGSGGGVYTVEQVRFSASGTVFTGNSSLWAGGALWVRGVGTLLDGLTVAGNTAGSNGGGLSGGGEVTLKNSTFSGNVAVDRGGGVLAVPTVGKPMEVENVTLSGNSAAKGGGFGVLGDVNLVHATIVGNTVTVEGAGVWVSQVATSAILTPTNTLLSANTGPAGVANCLIDATNGGTFVSGGGNLSDDASCTAFSLTTDQNSTPAGVDTNLQDNGGPTLTHALLAGSAAIDAGVATGVVTDQRGTTRDASPDVGAVEVGG